MPVELLRTVRAWAALINARPDWGKGNGCAACGHARDAHGPRREPTTARGGLPGQTRAGNLWCACPRFIPLWAAELGVWAPPTERRSA